MATGNTGSIGYIVMSNDEGMSERMVDGYIGSTVERDTYIEAPTFPSLRKATRWYKSRCDTCVVRTEVAEDNLPSEYFLLWGDPKEDDLREWPGEW